MHEMVPRTYISHVLSSSKGGRHARNHMAHCSWIYNYLCNQCLSPQTLWVRFTFRRDVLDTTLCDKACQWLAAGRLFSLGTPVSFTAKTDRHNITEIRLNVAFNTITLTLTWYDDSALKVTFHQWHLTCISMS